ncbi:PAS domain S-box protein [Candidatus Wolfebacteria bacterium]|nr:PAS domain S-box protein [Candidatus Wolfebacteria bacterium]
MNKLFQFFSRSEVDAGFSESELASIMAAVESGVIIYDSDVKILNFNKAAERIFGLAAEEAIGRRFSPEQIKEPRFKTLVQVFFPSLAPVVMKHSESGVYPQTVDIYLDNPKAELRVITNKIINNEGGVKGFVKIIIDRTREIEILESKNEFIAVAAHQLRTPLTAVSWIFELLSKESLNENQRQLVNSGLESSGFVMKIVNDLLDISKIEEGRFGYDFKQVNLIDFIEKILVAPEIKEIADKAGVKIYFSKPPESSIEINIDEQKLAMAIFNLIDNAVRYNVKNGEVIVGVEKLKDKPYVQISVKDTGIGISGEDIKKLFGKFFRAENAVKAATGGSGLGLYIVKNIIGRHGGEIWVESEINRGTIFYFTLPTDKKLIPQKEIERGKE